MDTKMIVTEAIEAFVKQSPCSCYSEIVQAVGNETGIRGTILSTMLKTMVADGLLLREEWHIPMSLQTTQYRWNYSGMRRIIVPAAQARPLAVKKPERQMPPMAWVAFQLPQSPSQQAKRH